MTDYVSSSPVVNFSFSYFPLDILTRGGGLEKKKKTLGSIWCQSEVMAPWKYASFGQLQS